MPIEDKDYLAHLETVKDIIARTTAENQLDQDIPMEDYIKLELEKYGLTVMAVSEFELGSSSVYHVTAKGRLWNSEHMNTIWPEHEDGYPGMATAMHNDIYYFAPENTEIVVVDSGDNIEEQPYLIFVAGSGGG